MQRLSGGRGIGDPVRGPALVSQQGFGVRYDLDPERGVIANPGHDLFGHSIAGQILICPYPTGGVGASWVLADLEDRGLAPMALVFRRTSPIFVQGAMFARIPIIHDLDDDPCTAIQSGDEIGLFPDDGVIEIYRPSSTT
jgi:predicted aconitase with swiveling domain